MCGISGYLLINQYGTSVDRILKMTRILAHRGPDDEGLTLFAPQSSELSLDLATAHTVKGIANLQDSDNIGSFPHSIAFGHRRFSIIDTSAAGHQPFWSNDRQVCVAFNGEIYNYVELRHQLQASGHQFRTQSDTEVLVKAYLEWGTDCFKYLNGFWALSLYDARKRAVLLSRDRIGVAPLYIAQTAEGLFWSSEIKSIFTAVDASAFPLNDQAVTDFIRHSRRDLFHTTFYQGITTFPNAAYAWIESDGSYQPISFWQLPEQRLTEHDITPTDAIKELRALLSDAVSIRLRADVPVGIELSGGMDSSAITGLAAQTTHHLTAFTVSFPGSDVDEEPFARKVAEYYHDRLQYQVLLPPDDDLFNQADQYIGLMEEPFHSPNMLTNQGIWREMAKQGIRVSLNGAAGDELLAGYSSDYHPSYLRRLLHQGHLIRFAKELLSFSEYEALPLGIGPLRTVYRLLPENLRFYRRLKSLPPAFDPFIQPVGVKQGVGPSWELHQRLIDHMGHWRMNYWLRSGNKSAMGVPLEVRAPFLDYRVIDFVFSLPVSYLIRDGWLKWILRQAVQDILPSDVVWRKVKMGFPFPYTEWLLASRERFLRMIGQLDCPYIDLDKLRSDAVYTTLVQKDPLYLWRIMSLALWWKKCVQGEPLQ